MEEQRDRRMRGVVRVLEGDKDNLMRGDRWGKGQRRCGHRGRLASMEQLAFY